MNPRMNQKYKITENTYFVICSLLYINTYKRHSSIELQFQFLKTMFDSLQASKQHNSLQDESEAYFLQPMFIKNPPNELISKSYTPDSTPIMRLVTKPHHKKSNVKYVLPLMKNIQLELYAQHFQDLDFLGKSYSQKINDVVYLKFNNQQYNIIPNSKPLNRLMSGLFVPFQNFNQASSMIYDNFTKTFQNNKIEISNQVSKSFQPTTIGCSFDPKFSSYYQSANLFAAIRKNAFEYDLMLQNDINELSMSSSWFNFAVNFTHEGVYTFNIVNLTCDLDAYSKHNKKIAYCPINYLNHHEGLDNELWNLGGQNITVSQSSVLRENTNQFYHVLSFEYRCKNKNDIIIFASNFPYSLLDSEKFFNKILYKKCRALMKIQKKIIGATISGTPLNVYTLSRKKARYETKEHNQSIELKMHKHNKIYNNPNLPSNRSIFSGNYDEAEKSIVFLARQCSEDVEGSFVMEGIIEYLLQSIQFESLKKSFKFYFIPGVNPDGIKYGNSKVNLTGSHLHECWGNPHKDHQAEVYQIKQFLYEINRQNPISMIMNLKSSKQQISQSFSSFLHEDQVEDARIFPYVMSKRYINYSFSKCTFQDKNSNSHTFCSALGGTFPKTEVYDFQISNFELQNKESGNTYHQIESKEEEYKQRLVEDYRKIGKDLIFSYLEHLKITHKNILLKDRWIKQIEQIQINQSTQIKTKYLAKKHMSIQERFPASFIFMKKNCSTTQEKMKQETKESNFKRISNLQNKQSLYLAQKQNIKHNFIRREEKKKTAPESLAFNQLFTKQDQIKIKSSKNVEEKNQQTNDQFSINDYEGLPAQLTKKKQTRVSILKNCSSNILNFEQNFGLKKVNSSSNFEKQMFLRKENGVKVLKRMKADASFRRKKDLYTSKLAIQEIKHTLD